MDLDFLPLGDFYDLQNSRLIGIVVDGRNGELSCLSDILLMRKRVLGSERLRLFPSNSKVSDPVIDQHKPGTFLALGCPIRVRDAIRETRGLLSSESQRYVPISSIRLLW